jgi:hypothetical protein
MNKFAVSLITVSILIAAAENLLAVSVVVPATGNIYLSGMPNGTISQFGDSAPANSPTQFSALTLIPGQPLSFAVTGSTNNGPGLTFFGADGNPSGVLSHDNGPENGISDVVAPIDSLLGVFLTNALPTAMSAPSSLTFSSAASRDYTLLSPALQQVFFIGDGLTATSVRQQITVPAGATRLFLGTMDASQWFNNQGSLSVTEVPEPSTALLFSSAGFVFALQRRTVRKASHCNG